MFWSVRSVFWRDSWKSFDKKNTARVAINYIFLKKVFEDQEVAIIWQTTQIRLKIKVKLLLWEVDWWVICTICLDFFYTEIVKLRQISLDLGNFFQNRGKNTSKHHNVCWAELWEMISYFFVHCVDKLFSASAKQYICLFYRLEHYKLVF